MRKLRIPESKPFSSQLAGRGISASRIARVRDKVSQWWDENESDYPWRTNDPYKAMVATALLQRTTRSAVAAFLPSFMERFPTWDDIATASHEDIRAFVTPLGLADQRASALKGMAEVLAEATDLSIEERLEALQDVRGVGLYLQSAFALYFGLAPAPLLDGSTARLLERVFGPRDLVDIRHDPYLQSLAWAFVDDDRAIELNWAMLDFAEDICVRESPRCDYCCVSADCSYAAARDVNADSDLTIPPADSRRD